MAARARALVLAGLCALAPGCAAVAAGGLGMMLSQEFQQGAQIVHYDRDVRTVWARAKETLAHLSSRQPIFDEDARRAYATVEGGSVSLEVVEVSEGRCRMAVKARKYGLQSADLALSVLDRIDAQIDG